VAGELEDQELKEALEKVYRRVMREMREAKVKRRVETTDPHGIYVYTGEGWKLLRREGEPFRLGELGDGIYVVYFDNTRCPACRIYDREWYPFVEKHRDEAHFVIVLCEWFARVCNSPAASRSFLEYRVRASPTTMFARVENGSVVEQVKREGALPGYELDLILESIKGRR
jgi:hypothetical protein